MKKILFLFAFISFYFCSADCTQPSFCNRTCWDSNGTHPAQSNPTQTTPTHIIVHHTGDGIVFPTNTDYADKVRFYWDLHVNTNGWSDIGYNWLIDRNGIIYEGRGDSILGAHFSGMNGGTMGVALIGDFTLETPSTNAINSLKDLIAWEATDKNIDVIGTSYHISSGLTLNNVSGHLDGGSGTQCPGTDLYTSLPSIRTSVSNYPCYNGNSNYPDLVIENMWTDPSNPIAGENIDLYVEIKNVGNQTANSISLDYKIDNTTIGSDIHTSLAPNESRTEFYNNYIFPNNASYNYCVFIDAVINEQNTSNNSYCINVSVSNSGGSENIQVSNTTVNPMTVNAGNNIDVTATQSYSGSQLDADLPSFDLDYYLSTDCNLSSNDILLGGDISSLGSDDPTHNESATLTIPNSTSAGTYFIIFSADNDNELTESDEDDNIDCIQITVEDALSIIDYEFQELLKVYPNPASNLVNITSNYNLSINKLSIYDLNGRLVKEINGNNLNKINISKLTNGIYLLKAVNDENKKAVFKIVKK